MHARPLFAALSLISMAATGPGSELDDGWRQPPVSARVRAYWWWLNGNVTRAAITRDLEAMKAKGFGGALICDADGASQDGNERVPHGPDFFSREWRELFRHTLREADRLGLELSLNIQSGWNLGGPMVRAEDAVKKLVWSETVVAGPARIERKLPEPGRQDGYYRDLFVAAYRLKAEHAPGEAPAEVKASSARRAIQHWEQKAMHRALHFSAPDTTPLLVDVPAEPGEEDTGAAGVTNLTAGLDAAGVLRWEAPAGAWQVLRFGCTIGDHARVSTSSDGWKGYALDVLDAGAFERYWNAVVEPLLADAGPLAGKTLRYLHTDSWEVEAVNWTPTLREEFQRRRGYDLFPFLPVLAGRIVESRRVSNRFLHDFRKTLGDLAIDHHYRLFKNGARRHGLEIHPESGGPHAVPVDAQRCLGCNDVPMSEFWAWSWRHRVGDSNRFFVKQPASAAHTYGRRFVAAEGFTTIGPHWQETLWDNLKLAFDQAACEGLNRLVWHAFTCSPAEMGLPGQEYFAGTHFNPNATWWSRSEPFLSYLNRCQWLLQQGLFVADALYYYGDHVPNFSQLKRSDPARVLPGFDYDVATEEVVLTRLSVRDGRLVLPDGMRYRLLVLPERPALSLPVLRKIGELVRAGATVLGPPPLEATGLQHYPACDAELAALARRLWGSGPGASAAAQNVSDRARPAKPATPKEQTIGPGRIITGKTAREVLRADGVPPDFECGRAELFRPAPARPPFNGRPSVRLDYIHRRNADVDLYFVANTSNAPVNAVCTFRVAGRQPELWNPVTGEIRAATTWSQTGGRTVVPLSFHPCGSWFVVFRTPARPPSGVPTRPNVAVQTERHKLAGAWTVAFDPAWGGPAAAEFPELTSWTRRPEEGIRFYSGTATYRKTFDLPPSLAISNLNSEIVLDLGDVRQLAEVRLNGRNLGVLWTFPFRVGVTGVLKPAGNELEIDVVNFWPNRIIGDALLPPERRRTRTNIRKLTRDTPLVVSGLLGPVRLLEASWEPPKQPR
ncbi:MAG: glycoside hydrolase [Verrucomicrobia bacterium]|nr:glycoside hydrolase [Verrucomicrobiota bacterium]